MLKKAQLSPLGPITEFDQFNKEVIPGYEILEQVGKGASGIVFAAKEIETGRQVAMKIFYLHYCKNKDFVRRLIREAETIRRLRHQNTVAGYGHGTHEGYYFTIMEFIEGETLKQLLKRKKRLDEKEAGEIILQMARALEAADELDIIHRDVKPSNIILSKDGSAKLTDFGLAREQLDTSLTIPGAIVGTPLFISPEQARGEHNIDVRSDIYSLGITFYTAVIGQPPFSDLNTSLLLTKKITDDIPFPGLSNPGLSQEVCSIILKMCNRDRNHRYGNPRELIRNLEKFLAGEFEIDATRIIPPREERLLPPGEIEKIIEREVKNETLKRLLRDRKINIRPRVLGDSDILFYEDDSSRESYLLLGGDVEILKAGRRVAVISNPGSFIGEMSTLLQKMRTATVRALNQVILLEIPEETFLEFLQYAPQLAFNLASNLAARLDRTTERLKKAQGHLAAISEHYRFIKEEIDSM